MSSSFKAGGAGGKNSKDVHKSLAQEWADKWGSAGKRQVQSRTVKIDGHDVLRWSVEEEVKAEQKDKQHAKDRQVCGCARQVLFTRLLSRSSFSALVFA